MLETEKRPSVVSNDGSYTWKYKKIAASDSKLPRRSKLFKASKLTSEEKLIRKKVYKSK